MRKDLWVSMLTLAWTEDIFYDGVRLKIPKIKPQFTYVSHTETVGFHQPNVFYQYHQAKLANFSQKKCQTVDNLSALGFVG